MSDQTNTQEADVKVTGEGTVGNSSAASAGSATSPTSAPMADQATASPANTEPKTSSPTSPASPTTSSDAPGSLTQSAADKAHAEFINDPVKAQDVKIEDLKGVVGKEAGRNKTGRAAEAGVAKLKAGTTPGENAGVDGSNVNVTVKGAPHPIVGIVKTGVADLRTVVANVQKQTPTPWLDRALKDLQTFEEWVVQHFEEMKKKL